MYLRKLSRLLLATIMVFFLAGILFFWSGVVTAAVINRLDKWMPTTDPTIRVEWRYTAGRIIDGGQDFGFIVSVSDIKVSGAEQQLLTVQYQDFTGSNNFAGKTYTGTLSYNAPTGTYSFKDGANQELVNWRWDDTVEVYTLTVVTAELALTDVTMIPQTDLIPEGGDGDIKTGRLGVIVTESDYYADWTKLEIGGVEKGTARIDMQGIRKASIAPIEEASDDYDHRWFAFAVDLADGTSAWVSAWKIEDLDGPFWAVTVAQENSGVWTVLSKTEEDEGSMVAPLEVSTANWQTIPTSMDPIQYTGTTWNLTAGITETHDLLDVQVTVPAGQFITSNTQTTSDWLLEAVGIVGEGTILGQSISLVKVAVAESSTEFSLNFLPLILK